jgi:glutamine phosphoribosylpyrophosphate amidotransferase
LCGLCGLAGTGISTKDIDAFETLFGISYLRGPHSTGLMTYNPSKGFRKKPIQINKRLGPSPSFLQADSSKPFGDRQFGSIFTEVFLGHCRYATVGKIDIDNAHPFDTGKYVSAHNGTLIDLKYSKDDKKTDSQMMFEDMESKGISPVLEDLSAFSAYAVSIFNKQTKELTFARNSERGLSVGVSKSRDVMFWASELDMLKFMAGRSAHKIELEYYVFEPDKIYTTAVKDIKGKNHNFWSIEDIKPKPKSAIASGMAGDMWDVANDEWCSSCGQVLWGRMLESAERVVWNNQEYFTCRECVRAGMDNVEKINKKERKAS